MRIRRYTGKDIQEAMLKVKMDLGSDAIILSTRKVRRKGIKGLFLKPLTEVLAAVDDDFGAKKKTPEPEKITKPNEEKIKIEMLEDRLNRMESMLKSICDDVKDVKKEEAPKRDEEPKVTENILYSRPKTDTGRTAAITQYTVSHVPADTPFSLFEKRLSDNEVEPEIIDALEKRIKLFARNPENYDEITAIAERIVKDILGQPQIIHFRDDGKPTVVMFVGPTGVGKTTTLAKIAAEYSLRQRKKVAFITADTYRIAAVDQLKTYAEILNIPVSVIYTPQEVKEAIAGYQDMDLILIDTAGRSHNNEMQFSELKELVNTAEADEIYLVLSCCVGRSTCRDILKHYSFLKDYKLLFTKYDEARVPGVILNVRYATGKPLSYVTLGQSVPDDIEVADVDNIVKSIF